MDILGKKICNAYMIHAYVYVYSISAQSLEHSWSENYKFVNSERINICILILQRRYQNYFYNTIPCLYQIYIYIFQHKIENILYALYNDIQWITIAKINEQFHK